MVRTTRSIQVTSHHPVCCGLFRGPSEVPRHEGDYGNGFGGISLRNYNTILLFYDTVCKAICHSVLLILDVILHEM